MNQTESLEHRIAIIKKVFGPEPFKEEGESYSSIQKYYKQSELAYSVIHSKGATHMGLSENGKFSKEDYRRTTEKIIDEIKYYEEVQTEDLRILELACGRGYNLAEISEEVEADLTGIDLTPAQLKYARKILGLKQKLSKEILII